MACKARPSTSKSPNRIGPTLGNRPFEVRPVGVWVQPEPSPDACCNTSSSAEQSAAEVEARLKGIQAEKAQKLRNFQKEVSRRVRTMQKLKQKEQLASSYRAVEEERKIILQSGSGQACKSLLAHKSNLKKPALKTSVRAEKRDCGNLAEEKHSATDSTQSLLTPRESLATKQIFEDASDVVPEAADRSNSNQSEADDSGNANDATQEENQENTQRERIVQFTIEKSAVQNRKGRSARPLSAPSNTLPRHCDALLYPLSGVQEEEERLRKQRQRALYRRLFMDRERENVQQAAREKEEKLRVQRLKSEAEKARRREERILRPVSPPLEPEPHELLLHEERLWMEAQHLAEIRRRKVTEHARFVYALREQLRERVRKRGVQLPPLCCCAASPFDTDPLTCANNCPFYRNPKAYGRALQSLLATYNV